MNLPLCPAPSAIKTAGPAFEFPRSIAVRCADAALARACDIAAALAGRVTGTAINAAAPFVVTVSRADNLSKEAYALKLSNASCEIAAATDVGVSRAFSTLAELMLCGEIPALEIKDGPKLASRGYMLDISRDRVAARRTLLYILDTLWLLKYNQLQLYTEHTFAFKGHELVWGNASPLRATDIEWLEDQCLARGIELVPNLNSLGHFGRWLEHPEYRKYSECPDGCTLPNGRVMPVGGTTLYPCPETLAFLKSLYDEYLPLFRSNQFNAGMDEPWELGLGRSKALCEKIGKHHVYLDHLAHMAKFAADHGKSLQFWADIVLESPEYVAELPQGITGMIWGYEAGHPFETQCAAFQKAGVPFVACPGTTGWNSLGGRWQNASANIAEAARAAISHNGKGLLLTDWGDNGHHQPPSVSLPPMALAADVAWNGLPKANVEDAINAILLNDPTRTIGGILTALGSAAERAFKTRIHNTSPAWKMFFAKQTELAGILPPEDAANLGAFREEIAELRGKAASSAPTTFGGKLVVRELDIAARMMDYGAFRMEKALGKHSKTDDSIPDIADEFEETWLKRSERGGLTDSLARITAIE
jgi:hexosaminidase